MTARSAPKISVLQQIRLVLTVFRREFYEYFASPLACIFVGLFVFFTAILSFYLGSFFALDSASLRSFFQFHPFIHLIFAPALGMRLWAEERKTGTIELLLTLPISTGAAHFGKFLAAWAFIGFALIMTFGMWVTVNWLGTPDNGVIIAGYFASFLVAGGFLAVTLCISAMTNNQILALILGILFCFLFLFAGLPIVLDALRGWLAPILLKSIAGLSVLSHFSLMSNGVIELRSIIFFASFIIGWLCAGVIVLDSQKAAK